MNPDVLDTLPAISGNTIEPFVEAASRISGVAAFFVALGILTYLTLTLLGWA